MKNKKSLFSLGLLALVLVLGVGYAVVSKVSLEIGGESSVKNSDLKVDIESVSDTKTGAAVVEHTLEAHTNTDTFTITKMSLNEEVKMTYTIKNHESDVTASLSDALELTYDNQEYFSVTATVGADELTPNAETTIVVTVKLTKTPVNAANATTTVSFKVTADPVDNSVGSGE